MNINRKVGFLIVSMFSLALAQSTRGVTATATGGTAVTNNGYVICTYTNSGIYSVAAGGTVDVLVVAGGGGGGCFGGGGGAGGLIYSNAVPVVSGSNYTVTVGGGGVGSVSRSAQGGNGSNSIFGPLVAIGGGGAGAYNSPYRSGNNGGSGGGAAGSNGGGGTNGIPGNGTPGQGNNGGTAPTNSGSYGGGGGGGAGTVGANGSGVVGGAGGSGVSCDILGTATNYAGGGGGGGDTAGAGGSGGGGAGTNGNANATAGRANTGGGGGGSRNGGAGNGGSGGSGIVIVRYSFSVDTNSVNLPQIADGVALNLSGASADVVGTLITNGNSAATVYLYWSTTDGTTNASAWMSSGSAINLGSYADGATFTNTLSGLIPDTVYFWNFMASNSAGTAWGATVVSPSFKTMGPPGVSNGGGASNILPYSATLCGLLTNGFSASATIYCGTDPNQWTYTNVLGTVTVAQGVFSTNQTGLARNTAYYYSVLVSNQYGTAQSPATNFTTLPYVWLTASVTNVESQTNLYSGLSVVLDGSNVVLTLGSSATYGYLPIYQFGNLIVTNGAAVVCLAQTNSPYTTTNRGVAIQVAGDLIIASNSSVNADGTGFAGGKGPGYTSSNLGGTHGGLAINSTKATYGSPTNPVCLGSGSGGHLMAGGGAIKLMVSGNLIINGRLSANGVTDVNWAGGAGGSLWIAGSGSLGGMGEIQVSGGNGYIYYGGGGGRLAIDGTVSYNFLGNIRGANGYASSGYGTPGSIYFGAPLCQNFTVYSNQTLTVGNDITNVFGNLTVYGLLNPGGYCAGLGTGVVIQAANITIAPSGAISADGWGFGIGYGLAGGSTTGSGTNGACHGGLGSYALGTPYGSATQPTSMGSGGVSGGGGAVKLAVSGALTVNGPISANGLRNGYNPINGAGGSIWIACGALAGTNTITANAGIGSKSGSGIGSGGGRIAIYYNTSTFAGLPAPGLYTNMESISSKVTVKGGFNIGTNGPEDGSIYIMHVVPIGTTMCIQ